jgi:phosphoglycolate phosphatase-like HAD superfamily hydrolase
MQLDALLARTPADLVFMDCDGVIYDTNRLKCDAYRHALEGYPAEAVEALVAHHRATGGVSRYLKLEHFFRDLHPVPDVPPRMERALARFTEYCERGYERMRPRPEALAFAEIVGGPERVHVVSGSDQAELRRVFDAADIRHRFAEIHGSPLGKRTHLLRICAERHVDPRQTLFVGDGWGDWEAATALEIPFVFLSEMSEWQDGKATIGRAEPSAAVAEAAGWDELLQASRRALEGRP